VTTSGTSLEAGAPSSDLQGAPIQSFHPEIKTRFQDDSKDRDSQRKIQEDDRQSKRKIEEDEASAQRKIKVSLVNATIFLAFVVSISGAIITFGHNDPKARELGVAVISAPIAGLFGILAGMGLK
jgi:hypothetical protein